MNRTEHLNALQCGDLIASNLLNKPLVALDSPAAPVVVAVVPSSLALAAGAVPYSPASDSTQRTTDASTHPER